jgi:hypothetical protein
MNSKPSLRTSLIITMAGEYEYTMRDGRRVPVTLQQPKLSVDLK